MKVYLIIAVLLSVAFVLNASNIIYVDANSPNEPGTGAFDDPFRKIQNAINNSNNSDIIVIRPGIYTGQGNYNLDPNGKSITIRSIDPNEPNIVANTVIDPNKMGRGFYLHKKEEPNCVIAGLTITNGYANSALRYNGGNVYFYMSSPTIRNCTIRNGYAEGFGGGLCCDDSNATVTNCTISGNAADYSGGGISCSFSDTVITGCTINGNTAPFQDGGGGIDCGESNSLITNCIITNNEASYGGGIRCYNPGVIRLVNCTITANSATYNGGAVYCQLGNNAIIKNSILWANLASNGTQLGLQKEDQVSVAYCDVQGGQIDIYDPCEHLVWGQGNIDTDPCFTSFDPNANPNLWDFHLQSAYGRWNQNNRTWITDSNTSLCIDAGDPDSDWSGEPWPNGRHINMGAYGGTKEASKNGNPADFNIDNSVNFADFAEFSMHWMTEGTCIEDLTGDGIVDFANFAVFVENWLWQR
jgi:hypothetical protein